MKHLSQMTREELWALDDDSIYDLCKLHNVSRMDATTFQLDGIKRNVPRKLSDCLEQLDTLRLELQQDAAEARQER